MEAAAGGLLLETKPAMGSAVQCRDPGHHWHLHQPPLRIPKRLPKAGQASPAALGAHAVPPGGPRHMCSRPYRRLRNIQCSWQRRRREGSDPGRKINPGTPDTRVPQWLFYPREVSLGTSSPSLLPLCCPQRSDSKIYHGQIRQSCWTRISEHGH